MEESHHDYFERIAGAVYGKFEDVKNPMSKRPDIHAFLLLEKLDPDSTGDIISAADHEEYWIDADVDVVFKNATDEQLRDISRCGIRYDDEFDCFSSFT